MRFVKLAAVLLCSTLLFCGCAKKTDVVLKINNKEITRSEFYDKYNLAQKERFAGNAKPVSKKSYAALSFKEQYITNFIQNILLEQDFDKREIGATDEEIEEQILKVAQQMGSLEQLQATLRQHGVSEDQFKKDMINEIKMQKLEDILGRQKATEADAEKYYSKNRAMFVMPERAHVYQIIIMTNAEEIKRKFVDEDTEFMYSTSEIQQKVNEEVARKEALANEVRAMAAKNPANFGKLAAKYSEDPQSAARGGDLGYVTQQDADPELGNAAFNLKIGEISPVIKTQFGYHIIVVKDRTPEGVAPFSEVKADLKEFLSHEKQAEFLQKYISGLKDKATIEYIDKDLDPTVIKKQLNEALQKQIKDASKQKGGMAKSKQKALEGK